MKKLLLLLFCFLPLKVEGQIIISKPITAAQAYVNISGAQWFEFQSTSALGSQAHSMIQMDIDKNQVAWGNSNGLFVDITGDYAFGVHLNMDALADFAVALPIGLHGPNQIGIVFDIDDTNNTNRGIAIWQGGTNGNVNQNLVEINAEENFLDGVYGGTFTGNFLNFVIRDVLKFRVDYLGNISATGGLLSYGTQGIGYGAGLGAGGTVTQLTSKATTVVLSTVSGTITTNNAALAAATIVSFTWTNTKIAATDVIVLNHLSGGTVGSYTLNAQAAAGSATVNIRNNTAGSLSEALVISFVVIKGATS